MSNQIIPKSGVNEKGHPQMLVDIDQSKTEIKVTFEDFQYERAKVMAMLLTPSEARAMAEHLICSAELAEMPASEKEGK